MKVGAQVPARLLQLIKETKNEQTGPWNRPTRSSATHVRSACTACKYFDPGGHLEHAVRCEQYAVLSGRLNLPRFFCPSEPRCVTKAGNVARGFSRCGRVDNSRSDIFRPPRGLSPGSTYRRWGALSSI